MARSRRACPERSRRNPGDACWQVLFGAFRPQATREIKKVTASERSASQIHRITEGLWRGVEEPVLSVAKRTPRVLILLTPFGPFQPPKPPFGGPDTVYLLGSSPKGTAENNWEHPQRPSALSRFRAGRSTCIERIRDCVRAAPRHVVTFAAKKGAIGKKSPAMRYAMRLFAPTRAANVDNRTIEQKSCYRALISQWNIPQSGIRTRKAEPHRRVNC